MAQENVKDWMEYAREYSKAQRELKIEKWVYITIEYRTKERQRVILFSYDLPRDVYERYGWVIRWRYARFVCLYPKEDVQTFFSYFDKRTGLSTDFGSLLSKLSAAKAQITIARRKEQEYINYQRQNNLFFNEDEDDALLNFRKKLQTKIEHYTQLKKRIQLVVEHT